MEPRRRTDPATPPSTTSVPRAGGGREELRANLLEAVPLEIAVGERRRRGSSDHVARRNSAQRHRRRDRLDLGCCGAPRARRQSKMLSARGRSPAATPGSHTPRTSAPTCACCGSATKAARCVSLSRSKSGSGEPHRRLRSDRGHPVLGAHDLPTSRRRRRSATAPLVLRRARR